MTRVQLCAIGLLIGACGDDGVADQRDAELTPMDGALPGTPAEPDHDSALADADSAGDSGAAGLDAGADDGATTDAGAGLDAGTDADAPSDGGSAADSPSGPVLDASDTGVERSD